MTEFDVIVVGAGHAGIEAALASARLGLRTACVTLRLDRIGHLPCNCSIGGPAKGHIAREVDALGGQMAVTTDYALTHIRRVGTGKGPAVQTVRAHVCKTLYPEMMRAVLTAEPNLTVIEGMVETVLVAAGRVTGIRATVDDEVRELSCRSVVLTTGTFLNGLCHEGQKKTVAARMGDQASVGISPFLLDIGVRLRRFKTGTTPRIRLSTIDFNLTPPLESELDAGPVSFLHDRTYPRYNLLPCWQTRTNSTTHALIQENLHQSAMYSGQIEGVGPRYCPSIEDKIVRFADKDSHPIFLEQEEWHTESVYVQGVSTSLPADVQIALLQTIPGLANMEMLRPGYAVEYDMADPLQLTRHLMSRQLDGLFLAGQLNGTSGYEEAAGQGIVAGINAGQWAREEEPVDFPRDNSFIGVMIDDLVTKGVEDPYRMLTARAEHRLLLRHDNADQRLTPVARAIGLCGEDRWRRFSEKSEAIELGRFALDSTFLMPVHNEILTANGTAEVPGKLSLFDLLKRPEMNLERALDLAGKCGLSIELSPESQVREQLELAGSYDGYIQKQQKLAEQSKRLEEVRIPVGFDFMAMTSLSYESKEKMSRIRPATVGQASRIPGVRPSDIALLIGHIRYSRKSHATV
ncbi:MAG: tRNA uridine-5-carboxymethylaminomethyl(34) synthesis enzyme MnmG [Fimbriimonas sp.]|nr:tRNA uridine-5-carboxymethylaminomethyl(34) synthesis enzyme MnmG [Fimbriimonas sp.]